jgi:hypothetical protein
MNGTPMMNLESANHDSNPGQFRQLPPSRIRHQEFAFNFIFVGTGKIVVDPDLGRFSSKFHQCTAALRRNEVVPQGLSAWRSELRCRNVMSRDFVVFRRDETMNERAIREALSQGKVVIVHDANESFYRLMDASSSSERAVSEEAVVVLLVEDGRLDEALRAMADAGSRVALVRSSLTNQGSLDFVGVITDKEIAAVSHNAARLMAETVIRSKNPVAGVSRN